MTCTGYASSANSSGLRTKMLRAKIAAKPVGVNTMQTFVNYRALNQNDRLNIKLFGVNPVKLNDVTVNPLPCPCPVVAQPAELQLCTDVSITTCQGSWCHMHQY